MSKLKGIKKFFETTSCSFGIHKWDKWTYTSQSTCAQKATCLRCKKEGQRTRHDWGNWSYAYEKSCMQNLKCLHCGEIKARIIHNWGGWKYSPHDDHYCKKERMCSRCSQVETNLVSHKWGPWEEHLDGDLRTCRDCGYHKVHNKHDWSPWREYKESWKKYDNPIEEALSGGDKKKCRRCDKIEKHPKHDWVEWTALFSDKKGVKCRRCGKKVILEQS